MKRTSDAYGFDNIISKRKSTRKYAGILADANIVLEIV